MNSSHNEMESALMAFGVQREVERTYLIMEKAERDALTQKYVSENNEDCDGWWTS